MKISDKVKETFKDKKKRKWIIIAAIVIIVGLVVANGILSTNKPLPVSTSEVVSEDMVQYVDLSGTVSAVETKSYYSTVTAIVGDINVKKGDIVKAGTVLFSFDKDNLEQSIKLEELKIQAAEGGYDKTLESNKRVMARLSEARTNLATLAWQIPAYENYINDLETKIRNKQNALAQEAANLQISLIDWEDNPGSSEYENLRKLVQQNQYEQNHNAEIQEWNKELEVAKETLSYLKSLKSQMESQEDSATDSALTDGGEREIEANVETVRIEDGNTLEDLKKAADGIKAEKDGIIRSIDVVSGAGIAKGAQMLSIDYLDEIIVNVKLSKYDLERLSIGQSAEITLNGNTYHGELSRISAIAEKSETGAILVDAEVRINDADEKIVLGLEAKVKIDAGEAPGALAIPNDAINYDSDGAFVMVVKDGVLAKQSIEVGLTDGIKTQIITGLNQGDKVVCDSIDGLEENMKVTPMMME
ncbi:MAG: efflux RND transporter periplasmic adaptor subunit [Lachnospiraceae bacterium]|nr:efflux RND transporter periplasmic adaptor subunit [Candidatus Colinaster scatohippi]